MEYNKDKVHFSRTLRKNMTTCEKKLWYHYLRNYPLKFRRQKIIGEYIADFYCAKAHLVIEVDGGSHISPQAVINENYRTRYLEDKGIKVLILTNQEIETDFYGICELIDKTVHLQTDKNYPSVTS